MYCTVLLYGYGDGTVRVRVRFHMLGVGVGVGGNLRRGGLVLLMRLFFDGWLYSYARSGMDALSCTALYVFGRSGAVGWMLELKEWYVCLFVCTMPPCNVYVYVYVYVYLYGYVYEYVQYSPCIRVCTSLSSAKCKKKQQQ